MRKKREVDQFSAEADGSRPGSFLLKLVFSFFGDIAVPRHMVTESDIWTISTNQKEELNHVSKAQVFMSYQLHIIPPPPQSSIAVRLRDGPAPDPLPPTRYGRSTSQLSSSWRIHHCAMESIHMQRTLSRSATNSSALPPKRVVIPGHFGQGTDQWIHAPSSFCERKNN